MIKHNQDGAVSGLAVSLVLTIVVLVGVLVFAVWAFSGRQDYKNHTDAKIAAAVTVAKREEGIAKDKQFAEEEKNPLRTYNGPEAYGSLSLQFPKTWSGYVDQANSSSSNNGTLLDGYFDPDIVPSVDNPASVFSLRFQVISQSYSQTLKSLSSSSSSDNPPVIVPYSLPKVPQAVGVKLTGTLPKGNSSNPKTGTMVVLPLRSQTLQIWAEGEQFQNDFNNIILPNFSFSP